MNKVSPWRAGVLLLAASAVCLPLAARPLDAAASRPAERVELEGKKFAAIELQVVKLINKERKKKKRSALKNNNAMAKISRRYSKQMNEENFFSHVSPDGEDMTDRFANAGVGWSWIGENLYWTTNPNDLAKNAVRAWMNSPVHRENIMNRNFSETGVGIHLKDGRYMFTQVFRAP
ncbi:MAG: CAP domain-containing protein [Armatimonadota bacterium]